MIRSASIQRFKNDVWAYYSERKRPMPWRTNTSLYYVIVSEIMLQQTQVHRVIPKFGAFIKRFPDWSALAKASTKAVLKEWSGLGYNRRALYLKRIAENYAAHGLSANSPRADQLKWLQSTKLPGIGPNTLGAIFAYAFNLPSPFIETNIRSVFIHHFCANLKEKVADEKIMKILEQLLTDPRIKKNPREWYWALMDYGAHLKKIAPNPSRKSTHHVKQKPFKGSNRELRSKILRVIMERPISNRNLVERLSGYRPDHIIRNISDLSREGFIEQKSGGKPPLYQIA